MACSTCPGGKNGAAARINEHVRQQQVEAIFNKPSYLSPPAGQEMIFILYTNPNYATHNVKSVMRPRMESGNIVSNYGRRRGARQHEIELVEELGGKLTVDQAKEYKLLNQCVFYVHPVDAAARPDLFKIIDTGYDVEEVVEETVEESNDEERAFTNYNVKGMTKVVADNLVADGWVTIDELKIAEPHEIEDSMVSTKTMTKLQRAEAIVLSARELA